MNTARTCHLSPPDFHRLDWACRPITAAFGHPIYLVGSALRTTAYRDVDLRLILPDDEAEPFAGRIGLLINIALSDLIAKAANVPVPVDFQIQSVTEAGFERGARNPIGIPAVGGRL